MALIRTLREDQIDPEQLRLAEDLELLTATQRTRLEGAGRLRSLVRFVVSFFIVFILPMIAFALIAGVLQERLGDGALAVGGAVLAVLVPLGMVVVRRLEQAGDAAELERKRRAVARVRQLDVSSVSSTSSVAVPVSSSVQQSK
jgi:hypothetical protein